MNHAQWLFEATALRKKEREEAEKHDHLIRAIFTASRKTLRELLVHILGLNIGAGKPEGDSDLTPYIPLTLYTGRPDVMNEMMEREKNQEKMKDALDNENLDQLNDSLMNLDAGDLEPLFTGALSSDPFERWLAPDNLENLRAVGVEFEDG